MKTETANSNLWFLFPKPNPQAVLRLFCFPFAGGGASSFASWAEELPGTVEVCAARLPGREARLKEPQAAEMAGLVDALTTAILPHLDRPFAFFGHGMGAIVAFEVARRLRRNHGLLPDCLFVSARVAPHLQILRPSIHNLSKDQFIQRLKELKAAPRELLDDAAAIESMVPVLQADFAIHEKYSCVEEAALDCDLIVFGGLQDRETSRESLEAWRQHTTRNFVRRLFPGGHFFISTAQTPFLRMFSQELYPFAEKARLQPKKKMASLNSQLISAEDKAALDEWFYLPIWKTSSPVAETNTKGKCWLILADQCGVGVGIAEKIKTKGLEAICVTPGTEYAKNNDSSFTLRISAQGDYSKLLKELRRSGRLPERIVHLWTVDQEESTGACGVEEKLDRSFYSLFYLAQAIGDQLTTYEVELCVISSDMQEVTGDELLCVEKAAVKGPCKVVRQEYPNIACRSIDISFCESEVAYRDQLVQNLTGELLSRARDQFVAFRQGQRWTQHFEKVRMGALAERCPRFREQGVYLVTGGMGGIGLAFAEYMFNKVRARLVLVGRTGLPDRSQWPELLAQGDAPIREKIGKIIALEKAGAEILMLTADVSRLEQMQGVVKQAVERFGTIHGVFHAAGVPGRGLTQLKSAETAASVLAPKVQGTLALETALQGIDLDFMVLVSSIAAFTGGGPGQIDYCAANSYLDSYARRNFRRHGITVAINFGEWQWDAWSEGLLGYPPEVREAFIASRKKFGIGFEDGMEAIARVLAADVPQFVVVTQNFISMVEGSNECTAAKLTEKVNNTRKQQQKGYPRPALGTTFVAASNELERKISEIWQRILGIESIGTQDNFFDLGGNSLVGLQVIAEMKKELAAEITPVALYEAPTVESFARYLNPDAEQEKSAAAEKLTIRRQQARHTRGSREIAIIGMAGRFPGAGNVREFWEHIRSGVELIRFYTDEELLAAGVSKQELKDPNYVKAGGDLDGIDLFDAQLFGYAPREAESIDPQHRLFLECAWEALEDAGYDAERFAGLIGVFGGSNSSQYYANLVSRPDLLTSGLALWQAGVGNTNDSLATRVSYKLNLKGPSMTVQTFCSTSGVAVHMASQSLLAGECDIALAGGVNVSVPNKRGYLYEEGGIISPDGHTRTFDSQAKGAVISDGVAMVVLKRLEEAVADGDHIYAVIKGSAINNDGSVKVGYTAPSVEGQEAAVLDALSVAGVEAETIQYLEAHGTATELGDPIEVTALSKAYGASTERVGYCAIGSVKTNVGHLDRAAGVTAVIKTALALQEEFLPPILHYQQPNPNIDFEHSPFYVCREAQQWKRNGQVRRAGVNVVGLGGTNVHLILEEVPKVKESSGSRAAQLLLLSAKNAVSLEAATERLKRYLEENPEIKLADVAYTLQVGRKKLEHRRAVVCKDSKDAVELLSGKEPQRILGQVQAACKKRVVFVLAGVGDQYVDLGRELYRDEAEFREHVDRCCELLQPLLGVDLRKVLFSGGVSGLADSKGKGEVIGKKIDLRAMLSGAGGVQPGDQLHQTLMAQPAVFVIEYALVRLLMGWGIMPSAMLGYSVGEYVAATVAGVFSLADALKLVAGRAKLIEKQERGAMLAVGLAEDEVKPLLGDDLWIAISNSEKVTVVGGREQAVAGLETKLAAREVVSRRLQTTHAFHTPMLEGAKAELLKLLRGVELKEPRIAYVSNLTGTWLKAEEAKDPDYWARHMCERVRFGEGVKELLKDRDRVFVEIGAGQTLGALIKQQGSYGQAGEGEGPAIVPTLSAAYQRQGELEYLLGAVGKLWLAGVEVEWDGFYAGEKRARLSLPTYPFDRQRYWVEPGEGTVTGRSKKTVFTGKKEDIGQWFYKPYWRESRRATSQRRAACCSVSGCGASGRRAISAKATTCYLLFVDEEGLAPGIARELKAVGERIVSVEAGQEFKRLKGESELYDASYTMRAGVAEDYELLMEELQKENLLPRRIGHLWTVNRALPAQAGDGSKSSTRGAEEDFAGWQDLGYYSILYTVQALTRRRILDPLELVVVSSNMQEVTGEEQELCPAKSTLLSPCKGIPQESPHIVSRSVDVELRGEIDKLGQQLAQELMSESSDLVVAYRTGKRLTQDYKAVEVEARKDGETRLRQHGVYLITGGLGGVGLILARHLAEQKKARLLLLGRTGMPEREAWESWITEHGEEDATSQKIRKLQAMEAAGGEVLVLAVDVSNAAQMKAAVETAYTRFGALHGVVHAAGISEGSAFRTVQDVGREDSEYHFQPKVYGLMALERALEGREIDFLLLTSSLSSVLAGMKLVPYAAANIFMDAYTRQHNRQAQPLWLTVNWDTWRIRDDQHGTLGKTVAEFEMNPEEGCEAFERLILRHRGEQIVESTGDLETRLDQWVRRRILVTNQEGAAGAENRKTTLYARPNLHTAYIPTSNDAEEKIAAIWQQVLGIENVGIHDNYFDLGGTSLSAIQVISELQKAFNMPVSPIVLFEASTVNELAKRLQPNAGKNTKDRLKDSVARRKAGRQNRPGSDIAIIGIAGRFPGANTIHEFWNNLRDGVESVCFFSDEELRQAGVAPELLSNPNYVKARPIIDNTDLFDAGFFGYNPREAEVIDPQHRVLLEVAWEALESAGYDAQRYQGTIGVFAGANSSQYAARIRANPEVAPFFDCPEAALANDTDSLTTAISYKLNLRGPSFCVQTFCSTSLVATHIACQNILAGECDMALAGGISLRVPQKAGYMYENGGVESPDGHSRTFDAKAGGTVFGEGAGLVVLKRLEDALADGDVIHAVIKGTAINNDGALKAGYTAPSVDGQAEVIVTALANAGVDPGTIHYVEASGTASELGDPIEVASLTRAFRAFTDEKNYCAIGSVKPNIGHPDRAAGVIGLIKTVGALKHKMIPPSLFFDSPNPHIDFENSPFFVNTRLMEWSRNGIARRAAVNSVGTGGTNAHAILEEAPAPSSSGPSRPWKLLLLSARTSSALEKATTHLAEFLRNNPDSDLADVAFTLQVGRRRFAHRRAVLCQSHHDAATALQEGSRHVFTHYEEPRTRSITFLFPDARDYSAEAASGLYSSEATFREEVDRCCELLKPILNLDLRKIVFSSRTARAFVGSNSNGNSSVGHNHQHQGMNRSNGNDKQPSGRPLSRALAYPAAFVTEYALAQLLINWGIRPQAMMGHGVGEYVAATISGSLPLQDALRLVCVRAKLMDRVAVQSQLDELELLQQVPEKDYEEFVQLLKSVDAKIPQVPYISHITDAWITPEEASDARYWAMYRHSGLSRFEDGLNTVLQMKDAVLLEVGSGDVFGSRVKRRVSGDSKNQSVLPTLKALHEQPADQAFLLTTIARLWLSGVEIDWNSFYSNEKRHRVTLPTYPFERQRYWIDASARPTRSIPKATVGSGKKPDIADWFYVPVWKQSPFSDSFSIGTPQTTGSHWMVLVNNLPLESKIVSELERRGAAVTQVRAGDSFSRNSSNSYTINPAKREHYDFLLEAVSATGNLPDRVVHLWGLAQPEVRLSRSALVDSMLDKAVEPLHYLVDGLSTRRTNKVQVFVVLNGAQKITGEELLIPESAILAGSCQTIGRRSTDISCRAVDVVVPRPDSSQEEDLVESFLAEMNHECADLMVAYRGSHRWTQSFEHLKLTAVDNHLGRLRPGGVYLITGGLGRIGLAIAQQLARKLAARLVLIDRSAVPSRAQWEDLLRQDEFNQKEVTRKIWQIMEIEEMGSEVLLINANVSNPAQMKSAVARTLESFGNINGVFHAARSIALADARPDAINPGRTAFTSTVSGLIVLEEITREIHLDFLALISSLKTVLGGVPGEHTCVADSYLDAFAHVTCSRKRPVVSINWDDWYWGSQGHPLAPFAEEQDQAHKDQKEYGIRCEEGTDALWRVLEAGLPQVVVCPRDLQTRLENCRSGIDSGQLETPGIASNSGLGLHPRSALSNSYVAPTTAVERKIAEIWQDLLGIDAIGIEDSFFELGGHSLLATRLLARVRKEFQILLSLRSIFELPTIASQAEMIEAVQWLESESGAQLECQVMEGEI